MKYLTLLVVLVLIGCGHNSFTKSEKSTVIDKCDSAQIGLLYDISIDPNRPYPVLPDTLRANFNCLVKNDQSEALDVCCFILLRSYLTQLKCCNQSYDLCFNGQPDSINNPVAYYFSVFANTKITCHEAPSSIPYEWVLAHIDEIENPHIKRTLILIEYELERIRIDVK